MSLVNPKIQITAYNTP